MMRGGKRKLSLEEYTTFFHDVKNGEHLTIGQLNLVVAMHGFCRVYRNNKEFILGALRSVDLIQPTRRSTVKDRATRAAALSLEDVKRDVEALGWQDSFLGSVVTVNQQATAATPTAVALAEKATTVSVSTGPSSSAPAATPGGEQKRRRRSKEGRRKMLLSATTALLSLSSAG